MDNVRPLALTRMDAVSIQADVESYLDEKSDGDRARRLEVANAARRWAARVDDQEFPPAPPEPEPAKYTPAPCTLEYCACPSCVERWESDRASALRRESARSEVHVELRSMEDFDDLRTDPVASRVNELPLRAHWNDVDG